MVRIICCLGVLASFVISCAEDEKDEKVTSSPHGVLMDVEATPIQETKWVQDVQKDRITGKVKAWNVLSPRIEGASLAITQSKGGESMLESIGNLPLLNTVGLILSLFIAVQFTGTILCILFAISKGVQKELIHLMWQREHLQDNLTGFTLWISSISSYYYFHHLMNNLTKDISLAEVLQVHPHVGWYVMLTTTIFLFFIPLDTIHRIVEANKRYKNLGRWKIAKAIIGGLEDILRYVKGPWGKWLGVGLPLAWWIGERTVKHTTKRAIQRFLARSSVEFGARVSIILGAIYCAAGEFILW